MSDRLNQIIEIVPGDEPVITFDFTDQSISAFQMANLVGYQWSFMVLLSANDPDNFAIFKIALNSGDPTIGQAYFLIPASCSSLLASGTKYYFRLRWIDSYGSPLLVSSGRVVTGS